MESNNHNVNESCIFSIQFPFGAVATVVAAAVVVFDQFKQKNIESEMCGIILDEQSMFTQHIICFWLPAQCVRSIANKRAQGKITRQLEKQIH